MDPIIIIFSLVILLFSIIIHELAHGYVALFLGDNTAKYAGRLTLNPIKHLDPIGSVALPLFLFLMQSPIFFGWAKPVPVNPYNFTDKKWGDVKVSIAGPLSNFAIAIFFGLILRFLPNGFLMGNPGLEIALTYITIINIWLGIFNLIPIPPLDGSWILFSIFPNWARQAEAFLKQYGFFILILLIFSGGLNWFFRFAVMIFYLITGTFP